MRQSKKLGRLWGLLKAVGVGCLLAGMMMWLSGAFVEKVQPGPPQEKGPPPELRTVKVEARSFPLLLDQVGTVRTKNEATVASRILAQVKEVLVREGEVVSGPDKEGKNATVLARLDDRDVRARLEQAQSQKLAVGRSMDSVRFRLQAAKAQADAAKAAMDQANLEYNRTQKLLNERAATRQQFDNAKAQMEIAQARYRAAQQEIEALKGEIARLEAQAQEAEAAVREANVTLSHTVITAPFSGQITRKLVEVGDMVGPGRPLFVLEATLEPEVHATVSESLLPFVRVGQGLEVRIDSLDLATQGTVKEVIPSADQATRTVMVKVKIPPHEGLVSGLFGRIRVPCGSYRALVVPMAAVREIGQLHITMVRGPDGHLQRRFVTLGHQHGDLVEVASGLKEGEEVVVP